MSPSDAKPTPAPRRTAVPAAPPRPAPVAPRDPVPVKRVPTTGIREQGYRHWEGKYTGHGLRWWTIARASLRATIYTKGRLFLILLLGAVAWIFPFFFGVFYFFGDIGGRATQSPDALLRSNLHQMLFVWTWMWAVVFSAVVGSRLVASDLRSEALYIYLSKPLRRLDYYAGKLLSCFLWIIPVTLLPALWVLAAANGSSNKLLKLEHPSQIFWETMGAYTLLILLCSSCAVAISSFTKRWALALVGWIGMAFMLRVIAEITKAATRNPKWYYISPVNNIFIVSGHLWHQPADPLDIPSWQGSLWALIGFIALGLVAFLVRVWKLEASE